MKRIVLFLSILGAAALLGAQEQPGENRPGQASRGRAVETVTLGGILALEQGRIALKSGEDRYFVAGIRPLVGFVEGLKEGAAVTVEGTVLPAPGGYKVLHAQKLSLGGKTYELPQRHRLRPDLADEGGTPGRDGRRDGRPGWGAKPDWNGEPGRCGRQGWGSPGRDRMHGRSREWEYRGGRHGPPVRPGAR
jgi:hypothetical protein